MHYVFGIFERLREPLLIVIFAGMIMGSCSIFRSADNFKKANQWSRQNPNKLGNPYIQDGSGDPIQIRPTSIATNGSHIAAHTGW